MESSYFLMIMAQKSISVIYPTQKLILKAKHSSFSSAAVM